MQTTCRCQKFRLIQYQPAEMKTVLIPFSVALIAGRSEIVIKAFSRPGDGRARYFCKRVRAFLSV